ncbi:MAG: helix-turn-helix transcriptional regulator [Bacteroidia bacterium]
MAKKYLTKREIEIIMLFVQRKARKEMPGILGIKLPTLDTHIKNIHFKTGTVDAVDLAFWINDNGYRD